MAIRRNKDGHLVGAKEKIQKAHELKKGKGFSEIESKREGRPPSQVVPLLVIGFLGVLAAVAGEDIIFNGQISLFADFQTNQLFFGKGVPSMMDGGGDVDHILVMLARAFFLMVVFGLPAAVTFGIYKMTRRVKAHLFLTNWCAVLLLFIVVAVFHEHMMPILSALF